MSENITNTPKSEVPDFRPHRSVSERTNLNISNETVLKTREAANAMRAQGKNPTAREIARMMVQFEG